MRVCSRCGAENPIDSLQCSKCRTFVTAPADARESEHIGYLLEQLTSWRKIGWIIPSMADRIERHYRARLHITPASADFTQTLAAGVPAAAPPPSETSTRSHPWFGEFLEAHWLKLLAALAAVFIFVGMRQVLGWEWVSILAELSLPLLPIGLSAGLYYFGMKARSARSEGGFAYLAVSIVLAAYAVFSVNQRWLLGALPEPTCLAAACAVSTALAAVTLAITRQVRFLHIFLAGCLATLNAALRTVVPEYSTAGMPVLCMANLALAGALLLIARRINEENQEARHVTLLWGHLSTAAALLWISLPAVAAGARPENTAILLFAASGIYVLAASAFASARMGYASGALGAATAFAMLLDLNRINWYPAGFAAFTLAATALTLSRLNRREEQSDLSRAYSELADLYALAAAGALAVRAILSISGPPLTGPDWPAGVLLAALCTLIYGSLAAIKRSPRHVITASAAAMFGLTLASFIFMRAADSRVGLAHSLLPFIIVSGGLAVWMLRFRETENPLAPYALSILPVTGAAAAVGLEATLLRGIELGPTAAFWAAAMPYAIVCGGFAQTLPESAAGWWQRAWSAACIGTVIAMAGFAGVQIYPAYGGQAAGIAIGIAGFALLKAAGMLPQAAAPAWQGTLVAGAVAAGGIGGLLAAGSARAAPELIVLGTALNLLLLAVMFFRENWRVTASAAALVSTLALVRLSIESRENGVLFALLAGCLFAEFSWRANKEGLAWLAVCFTAAAGLIGITDYAAPTSVEGGLSCFVMTAGGAFSINAAARWGRPGFAIAGGTLLLASYVRAIHGLQVLDPLWLPLAMLPALALLYAGGLSLKDKKEAAVGAPLQDFAVAVSICAWGVTALHSIAGIAEVRVAAVTSAVYGVCYLLRAYRSQTPFWIGLAAATLSVAAGFGLAEISGSEAQWAAAFGTLPLGLLAAAHLLRARDDVSLVLCRLCALEAGLAAAVGFVFAGEPGQGTFAVAALAESGAVFAGIAILRREWSYSHSAFACWFAAYGLMLYDRMGIDPRVLDYYLLPFGLYLLAVSHMAARRAESDAVGLLWWAGLLTLFGPTYAAFRESYFGGGSPVHAMLLLLECVGAVAWGIAHRIRAFVLAGTAFSLAFAVTLASAAIVEVWTGVIAVIVGVSLLSFVFYVSLHQESIRARMQRFTREWSQWR